MNTRTWSANTVYPFKPGLDDLAWAATRGIADIYVVVEPRVLVSGGTSYSSSSSSLNYVIAPYGRLCLIDKRIDGSAAVLTFQLDDQLGDVRLFSVTVPTVSAGGGIITVRLPLDAGVQGVLVCRTMDVQEVDWSGTAEVEPTRLSWYGEVCAGIQLGPYTVTALPGEELVLALQDGYNTHWEYTDGTLQLVAGAGQGKGRYPSDSGSSSSALPPPVVCINGLPPNNDGDVPIVCSPRLSLSTVSPLLEVIAG